MKNKIVFAVIFITIISIGTASLVILIKGGGSVAHNSEIAPQSESEFKTPEEPPAAMAEEPSQIIVIQTDSFDLALPVGWEMTTQDNVLPTIVVNSSEEFINEKVEEIDFKTNISINGTQLGDYSLKDYVEIVKENLIISISDIKITKEEPTAIADREAYFMEIESAQQGLDFNTFITFIVDKDNFVWAFSFNTLRNSWPEYKEIFYQTIKNIEMKQG